MSSSSISVSSGSFDEKSALIRITIEGRIPLPRGCDDPIVELFRPIRNQFTEDVFLVILVTRKEDCVICEILPSNRRNRTKKDLIEVTKKVLLDETEGKGVLQQYINILEEFFQDKNGLEAYLEKVKQITQADEKKRPVLCSECSDIIKEFAAGRNLEIPSLKTRVAETLVAYILKLIQEI